MTRTAIYAGSFDPITYGHLDIIQQASGLFDKLYVAVGTNTSKTGMFEPTKRLEQIQEAVRLSSHKNVQLLNRLGKCQIEVALFSGMLVDYMAEEGISFIVRGLRDHIDFGYESHIARINAELSGPPITTVWLYSRPTHAHVSSSLVREMLKLKSPKYTMYTPIRVMS